MRTRAFPQRIPAKVAARLRIAVVRAEFNSEITESLESACVAALESAGIPGARVERFRVPGCFEIPIMSQRLARRRRYDAIIALGAVIKGDTFHFELVASECARGVMKVSLKHDIPIIFEVLAVYNRRDALRRAGKNGMNKGIEAAGAALSVLGQLRGLT
jgi:6,7-dimethyl-8-ribityllumazine synthase